VDTIARALVMYAVLLVIFLANGKRTLAQITTFDFVLLLILGEVTQQALTGDDYSITTAVILIVTLIGVDTTLTLLQRRSRWLNRLLEGTPLVLIDDGAPLEDRMRRSRVEIADILAAAREKQGLERLEQIKYAILENNGSISIIPRR
jgi:uncharacterized membrane protein YcaP (DUF421 family)